MLGSGPDILLVRGAPGVGKSTAVGRMRRHLHSGAIVEVDVLRGMIAGVEWTNKVQHVLALEHAHMIAGSFLAHGLRPVVIVDTLGRARLDTFLPMLATSYRVVSLYARPEVLANRVDARPEGQFKNLEACMTLNDEIARHRYPHESLVDTSDMSPD
jgi:cytidylate kinase